MTQTQFMYELMVELADISDKEKVVIMNDYTQLFSESIEQGVSEENIIASLATPKEIAQSYKDGSPLPIKGVDSVYNCEQGGNMTTSSIMKFILLIPVAILYVAVTSALGLATLFLCLVLCAASVCISVFSFTVASLQTGFILLGIGGIFFTLAFLILCVVVFKSAIKIVLKFPKYMGSVLRNNKKAVSRV